MTSETQLVVPQGLLRQRRLEALMTQELLAERSGVSIQRIKQIEAAVDGAPIRPDTVRKLARAMRCRTADLATVAEVAS